MEQSHQTKEMSGNKMAKIILGTIVAASIIIVGVIQAFYMLWEPKEPTQNERQDENEKPSYSKSAMLHYDDLLRLG